MPVYTDLQRSQLRQVMGYTKLFSSSNAIFEDVLNVIQGTLDDGSTFNNTITLLTQILAIDAQRLINSNLGLPVISSTGAQIDAARNDAMLKSIGRTYIKQLSIIFAMHPAQDYYGRPQIDNSGNINTMPNYDL